MSLGCAAGPIVSLKTLTYTLSCQPGKADVRDMPNFTDNPAGL